MPPDLTDEDKKKAEDFFSHLNRKERRKLGKKSGVKIPGANEPYVKKENRKIISIGTATTERISIIK